jgi:hypothetical protein
LLLFIRLARQAWQPTAPQPGTTTNTQEISYMFKEESIMNEQIRRAIRQRARAATTKDDLVHAIFESFRAESIDVRDVSLEDMKDALFEAACAAREEAAIPA